MTAKWIEEADRKTSCNKCGEPIKIGQRFYWLRRGTYYCELCGSEVEMDGPEVGKNEAGALGELSSMPAEAAEGALGVLLLDQARRIDGGDVADRDYPAMVQQYRQTLLQLRDQFPPAPEEDDTTKKRKARERRLLMGGELTE